MKKPENEKKKHLVKCYLDDKEYLVLKELSYRTKMSNSEILRSLFDEKIEKAISKNPDKKSLAAQEKELIKNALYQLSKVGNNLNQLTRLANQGSVLEKAIFDCLEDVSKNVKALRERIEHGNSKAHRSKK